MTKIKLCGLTRGCDVEAANGLLPEYIGFVFARKSPRYVTPEMAQRLKCALASPIQAVGVFADEAPETVASLLNSGVIDMAQLHGHEDEAYIRRLRELTGRPVMKAFRVKNACDILDAEKSSADHILLDSGAGTGRAFDWRLIQGMKRPYFLAGGLEPGNVAEAVKELRPYGVDVSSGIEAGGSKDQYKMAAFVAAVRKDDKI